MTIRDERQALEIACTTLVLARLFGVGASVGRPSLRDALTSPGLALEPLSSLSVDSLAWLELVTTLETDLGLPLHNDFLEQDNISAHAIGVALARSLEEQLKVPAA